MYQMLLAFSGVLSVIALLGLVVDHLVESNGGKRVKKFTPLSGPVGLVLLYGSMYASTQRSERLSYVLLGVSAVFVFLGLREMLRQRTLKKRSEAP